MRPRTTRLGRWCQQIAAVKELVDESNDLVVSLTHLTHNVRRFIVASAALVAASLVFVAALR